MKVSLQPSMARAQRGYSLIELSIALAILSVVIVGALLGVQRILDNNKANNVIKQVPFTHAGLITATTSTSNNFVGLTTAMLGQFGNFQEGTVTGTGNSTVIGNPFGGVYLAAANTAAQDTVAIGQGYFFSVTSASRSMCTTLVNGLAPIARQIWVGPTPATAAARAVAPGTGFVQAKTGAGVAVTLANLSTACAAGTGAQEIVLFLSR